MKRSDIFLKVIVEHEDADRADHLANEICRRIEKLYGVRSVEISSLLTHSGLED